MKLVLLFVSKRVSDIINQLEPNSRNPGSCFRARLASLTHTQCQGWSQRLGSAKRNKHQREVNILKVGSSEQKLSAWVVTDSKPALLPAFVAWNKFKPCAKGGGWWGRQGLHFLLVRIYWGFGKQISNLCIWGNLKSMLTYQELPQDLHVSLENSARI